MGVDVGLLINTADTFERTNVERILRTQIAVVVRLDLTKRLLFFQLEFNGLGCDSVTTAPVSATCFSIALRRSLKYGRSCLSQMLRASIGETKMPRLRNLLLSRVCPCAGSSVAYFTTASFRITDRIA